MKQPAQNKKRKIIQWSLLWLVIMTMSLGWKYPILGYSVPVVMILGIIGSMFRGRYVCGKLCPRGGFLDRIISIPSKGKKIPEFIRKIQFRWAMIGLLMTVMIAQGLKDPTNAMHWGEIFWSMCTVTTAVAVILGIFIHPRTWCAFCPMGTMQNIIGGNKGLLQINGDACKGCKICEKSCTLSIPIVDYKQQGYISDRDCLKCSECISICPTRALTWPS